MAHRVQLVCGRTGAALVDEFTEAPVPALKLRDGTSPEELLAAGRSLSEWLPREVLGYLCRRGSGKPLHLKICTDRALAQLPWEAAWLDDADCPLGLHPNIYAVRAVDEDRTAKELQSIRVLVVSANPSTVKFAALPKLAAEVKAIESAIKSAEATGCDVRHISSATPGELTAALADFAPSILHFCGHIHEAASGCALVLHGARRGTAELLYTDELSEDLRRSGTEIVVLSGCSSMAAAEALPVSAAIGMHCPISDAAAHHFSRALFASLLSGECLERAVADARSALTGLGSAWAVPVLFAQSSISLARKQAQHNIPAEEEAFIGRARELQDLQGLLVNSRSRLTTITGMGGMGKTTLAKHVARQVAPTFPGGAWMIDCEALQQESDLVSSVAACVGLQDVSTEEELLRELRTRSTLLVLDCFEESVHLAPLIGRLISGTEHVQILVTSRILLGVKGEAEFELHPLSVGKKPKDASESLDLFLQAARTAIHDFKLSPDHRADAIAVCSRVEGVPLALVLAAGRLKYQTLAELRKDLDERLLDTLRRKRVGKDRHNALAEVIAGSYRLLPEEDQALLRQLSVFAGGFYREQVAEALELTVADATEGLGRLRENSLVRIIRRDQRTRYKLLDTVREYLLRLPDQSGRNSLEECRRRHAQLFGKVAAEIRALGDRGSWPEATELLLDDLPNLRAAVRFSVEHTCESLVRDFAKSLAAPFFEAGLWPDLDRLTKAGLQLDQHELKSHLLGLQGALASRRGYEEAAERIWLQRLEICKAAGDQEGFCDTLSDLADQAFSRGDLIEAERLLLLIDDYARSCGNTGWLATTAVIRARMALSQEDKDAGRRWGEAAENFVQQGAELKLALYAYQNLTRVAQALDEPAKAKSAILKVLELALESNRAIHAGWALLELGPVLEAAGDIRGAVRAYLGAVRVHTEFATRHKDRANKALAEFKRRHSSDDVAAMLREFRTTPWRRLVQPLVYV